jgi:hypothetical protein
LPLTHFVRRVIDRAKGCAQKLKHNYVGTEHLLLGLILSEGWSGMIFSKYGVTAFAVEEWLKKKCGIMGNPTEDAAQRMDKEAERLRDFRSDFLANLSRRIAGFDLGKPCGDFMATWTIPVASHKATATAECMPSPMLGDPPTVTSEFQSAAEVEAKVGLERMGNTPNPLCSTSLSGIQVGEEVYLVSEAVTLGNEAGAIYPARCLLLAKGPRNSVIWPCWKAEGKPMAVPTGSLYSSFASADLDIARQLMGRLKTKQAEVSRGVVDLKAKVERMPGEAVTPATPHDPYSYLKGLPKPQTLGSLRKGDWFIHFPGTDRACPEHFAYGTRIGVARLMQRADDIPSQPGVVTIHSPSWPSWELPEETFVIPVRGVPGENANGTD